MDYVELSKERRATTKTIDESLFRSEQDRTPVLHSGFTSSTKTSPIRSVLQLHIYFADGNYVVRIEDREDSVQAFLEVEGLANLFTEVEKALVEDSLRWKEVRRNGRP